MSKYLPILAAVLLFLSACSSNDSKIEVGSEQKLYENAQRFLRTSNWNAAIQTLQLLEENFPFGNYAEQSQLELIYGYFKGADYELAIASADRFIRLHPQHRNVDYAYYMRGIASFYSDTAITTALIRDVTNRDSGSAKESFNYFSQLLQRYPNSNYALDARQRMIYLRNNLARYEIHVANYYFRRGAFVAAANRGRFVVENMQNTAAVPDGLAVMAQAYHLLGMQDLANDAERVLLKNFPQHPAIENGKFVYRSSIERKKSWLSYVSFGLMDKREFAKFDSRDIFNPQYRETSGEEGLSPPRS